MHHAGALLYIRRDILNYHGLLGRGRLEYQGYLYHTKNYSTTVKQGSSLQNGDTLTGTPAAYRGLRLVDSGRACMQLAGLLVAQWRVGVGVAT